MTLKRHIHGWQEAHGCVLSTSQCKQTANSNYNKALQCIWSEHLKDASDSQNPGPSTASENSMWEVARWSPSGKQSGIVSTDGTCMEIQLNDCGPGCLSQRNKELCSFCLHNTTPLPSIRKQQAMVEVPSITTAIYE